jgi:hypothetical protein
MKQNLLSVIALLLFCITANTAFSQEKKDTAIKTPAKSYFKIDGNFINNAVYLGRKDSMNVAYLTPSIGYYDKSGLYISGSLSYLTSGPKKRIDLFALSAGYDFSITEKFTGGVYVDKSFYNDSSDAVSSSVNADLGANFAYDFGFLQAGLGTSVSFAGKPDYGLTLSVGRAFYVGEENNQWTINPAVAVNMSTLNFYEGYTSRTNGKRTAMQNPLIQSVSTTTTVTNTKTSALTLMDYEISVPVSYDSKKWGIYFTPTLAIPQNPIYTKTTAVIKYRNPSTPQQTITFDSTPNSEKKLENTFFAEVGVYFKF